MTSRRLRVLFVSEVTAQAAPEGIRIPDGHRRRYGEWSQRFDMTWTLTRRQDDFHAGRLPPDATPLWLPGFASARQWLLTLPRVVARLWSALREHDVVVVNAPSLPALPALVLARLRRVPAATLQLSRWEQLRPRPGRPAPVLDALLRLAGQLAVLLSRHTYVAGSTLLDEVWAPLRSRATSIVYPAISVDDLQPRDTGDASSSDRVRLLTVGRFIDTKRIDVVLQTTAELRRRGVDASVTVVGDGVERPAIEAETTRLGLQDHVTLTGWLDDWDTIRGLYHDADAFVFASVDEGLPLVVMEAMAFGVPVVSTPAGGLATFLEPDTDALVVPSPDPSLLADAVERVLGDPRLRTDLVAAARRHVAPLTREAWLERLDEDLHAMV